MRYRFVTAAALATLLVQPTVFTQARPAQNPAAPATAADIEALTRQIQALLVGQAALQKEIQEIRALLQQQGAARPAAAPPAQPAPVTTVDTLVETAGAQSKGAAGARLTIIEFSDFECPFCGRYARDTYTQLDREYIATGKARYVFRNFPLESIHPNAFRAAAASICAAEQGKYWEMHDRLFQNQTALAAGALAGHAVAIGADAAKFNACMGSERATPRIRQDQADAQKAGVGSTPSFLIGVTTAGDTKVRAVRMIRGAQPFATFKATIDQLLAAK
jgi:protein-disulfide isomerase